MSGRGSGTECCWLNHPPDFKQLRHQLTSIVQLNLAVPGGRARSFVPRPAPSSSAFRFGTENAIGSNKHTGCQAQGEPTMTTDRLPRDALIVKQVLKSMVGAQARRAGRRCQPCGQALLAGTRRVALCHLLPSGTCTHTPHNTGGAQVRAPRRGAAAGLCARLHRARAAGRRCARAVGAEGGNSIGMACTKAVKENGQGKCCAS